MDTPRYHTLHRVIHWTMALIIISLFAVGLYMTGMERENPLRGTLYGLHKSFGVLILFLVVLRIITRLATKIPAMPKFAKWENALAHIVHFALYCLMAAVPLAGIWMSNSWGHGVSFFGVELPRLFAENKEIGPLASEIHEILAFVIIGIASLHIIGALKHRYIDKHDIIYRMGFGRIPANAAKAGEDMRDNPES
ncbi:MAG: cytochrome b [Alphaproteobacteria bacterium]|nr:cytochrome b [Alphaproteobacteria bacterium]